MLQKLSIFVIGFCLTGCIYAADPFNFVERTQLRTQAEIAVAQAERDAAIGVAEAEASKSQAWAMVAVPLALVVVGGAIVGVVVWWQGRIYYARATGQDAQPLMITARGEADLRLYARQVGGRLEVDNRGYKVLLADGRAQRLLPVKSD